MLTYNDSRLDTNDFLLEHYSTDEERKTLSELETAYGTALDEYYAMGTNPDATAEDVNNTREKLLNLYGQWHEYTKQMAHNARHRYIDACYAYAKEDSRRTPASLIRNDIKAIMCESTAQDYLRFMAYLKMDTGHADTDTTAYSNGAKAKALREVITGKTDIDIPEELTDANKGTLMMYLYMRIEAQVDALTVMGIEYNHREVRQRAREILSEMHDIDTALVPSSVPDKVTAPVSNAQKALYTAIIETSAENANPIRVKPINGIDAHDRFIVWNENIGKPERTTQIDRFISDVSDTWIDESENGIAIYNAETITRTMMGIGNSDDCSDGLLNYVESRLVFLTSTRCLKNMDARISLFHIDTDDFISEMPYVLNATPCAHFTSNGKLKGTFYKATAHSPFYQIDKKSKQIGSIKTQALRIASATKTDLIKKTKEKKTTQSATERLTELKLFLMYNILDMNGKHYSNRLIKTSDIYDDLMIFDKREEPYKYGDTEKIIASTEEILRSFKISKVIKNYHKQHGAYNRITGFTIVMPGEKDPEENEK